MKKILLTFVVFGLGLIGQAVADPIISAVSATINSGGVGFGSINDTFNQNGLYSGYVSGVTDFDTYLATNPTHTLVFSGNEWFSDYGTSSAIVTYDLGSDKTINALALWNEESSGIGSLNLLYSTDNLNFFALATGLIPFDNPLADYGAEVFSFGAVTARYVRFDISNSPQLDPGSFPAAAIGEVAFRETTSRVPDSGTTVALLGVAFIGLASLRRRFAS